MERLTASTEVEALCSQLKKEKERAKKLWALSCKQAMEQEELLVAKELEVEDLRARLEESVCQAEEGSRAGGSSHAGGGGMEGSSLEEEEEYDHHSVETSHHSLRPITCATPRKGKAPPIDPYTGESPEKRFDDYRL